MDYNETNYPIDGSLKQGDSISFNYTGTYKEIILSRGIYSFECWGGQGGAIGSYVGGKGGYTYGKIKINKLTTFFIFTGGSNALFNGGGNNSDINNLTGWGAKGGGASDIRLVSGVWDNINSLRSRIMVAAGGGGANYRGGSYGGGNGGNGGGLVGSDGIMAVSGTGGTLGRGGTQTGSLPGDIGIGGGFGYGIRGQAGGGSGYYGGSGGAHAGGGGGSSFISGMVGCNAVDENGNHTNQPIHYSDLYFTDYETQSGIRSGNGLIKITVLSNVFTPSYLINIDDDIHSKTNENILYSINKTIATINSDDFANHGLEKVELSDNETSRVDILCIISEEQSLLNYEFVPSIQLIENNSFILFDDYSLIENIIIKDVSSEIKYILNNGSDWYTIKDNEWSKILEENINANYININGLTSTQLSNFSQLKNYLFTKNLKDGKIKFIASLNKNNYDDILNIEKFSFSKRNAPYKKICISSNLYNELDTNEYLELLWETANKNKIEIIYDLYDDKNYYNNFTYPKDGNLHIGKRIIFHYVGYHQELLLNTGIYKFECYGASGEGGNPFSQTIGCRRGFGGYTYGTITINKPTLFYLYVGGSGIGNIGGWNGGGDGIISGVNIAGAGGGASDIRLTEGHWSDIDSLKSRIMVAAGGGGSNYWYDYGRRFVGTGTKITSRTAGDGSGGDGGGLIGLSGFTNGKVNNSIIAGNQTSGFKFGLGQSQISVADTGAGGAGYYGGLAGIIAKSGGAGGSSFISGMEECNAIDENGIHTNQPIHYSGLYFDDALTIDGIRDGDGVIIITPI